MAKHFLVLSILVLAIGVAFLASAQDRQVAKSSAAIAPTTGAASAATVARVIWRALVSGERHIWKRVV